MVGTPFAYKSPAMKRTRAIFLVALLLTAVLLPAVARADERVEASAYLWRLINEARVHPLEVIRSQGLDEEKAREALGEDAWMLDRGLAPLAWNGLLFQAAAAHGEDMVARLYYSATDPEGRGVGDRVDALGYGAVAAGELLGVTAFYGFLEPLEAARLIFSSWLVDELTPGSSGPRRIFNPEFTELGISFSAVVLDLGPDVPHNIYLVVADCARPREQRAYILGSIYADSNGNGRWDLGEGRPDLPLHVRDVTVRGAGRDSAADFTSGVLGVYQLPVGEIYFSVTITGADGQPLASGSFNGTALGRNSNCLVDFSLE